MFRTTFEYKTFVIEPLSNFEIIKDSCDHTTVKKPNGSIITIKKLKKGSRLKKRVFNKLHKVTYLTKLDR